MEQRNLKIGQWEVEFYFAITGYDSDVLIDRMFDFGAGIDTMKRALRLMESGSLNTGLTFSNPDEKVAIVAIGPTSSADEFIDSLSHEVYHLAVAIADSLGIDLMSESPAYMVGDSMRELADLVCSMGCKCH